MAIGTVKLESHFFLLASALHLSLCAIRRPHNYSNSRRRREQNRFPESVAAVYVQWRISQWINWRRKKALFFAWPVCWLFASWIMRDDIELEKINMGQADSPFCVCGAIAPTLSFAFVSIWLNDRNHWPSPLMLRYLSAKLHFVRFAPRERERATSSRWRGLAEYACTRKFKQIYQRLEIHTFPRRYLSSIDGTKLANTNDPSATPLRLCNVCFSCTHTHTYTHGRRI